MTIEAAPVTGEPSEPVEPIEGDAVDPVDPESVEIDPDLGAKKAIAAERQTARESDKRARAAEKALAELRQELADKDKPADEQAVEKARREAAAEATKGMSDRIIKAEVKAALAGKVADPARVLGFVNISDIELGDDGDIDGDAVADAVEQFLADYPEFKVEARGAGSADQFSRGRQQKPEKPNPNDLIRAAFKKD